MLLQKIRRKLRLMRMYTPDPNKYVQKFIDMQAAFTNLSMEQYDNIKEKKFLKATKNYITRFFIKNIKFPYYDYKFKRAVNYTLRKVAKSPGIFVLNVTKYLMFIGQYSKFLGTNVGISLEEMEKSIFDACIGKDKIFYDFISNEQSKHLKYILSYTDNILEKSSKYHGNLCTTKLTISANMFMFPYITDINIEETIYSCTDPKFKSTSDILSKRFFNIDNNGVLTNPNYSLSDKLIEEDYEYYRILALRLLTVLVIVCMYLVRLDLFKIEYPDKK